MESLLCCIVQQNFKVLGLVSRFVHVDFSVDVRLALNLFALSGENGNGRLGTGDINNRGEETEQMGDNLSVVGLGSDFEVDHVSCGGYDTCVLSTNNQMKCFGKNSDWNFFNSSVMGDDLPVVHLGVDFDLVRLNCGEKFSAVFHRAKSVNNRVH